MHVHHKNLENRDKSMHRNNYCQYLGYVLTLGIRIMSNK